MKNLELIPGQPNICKALSHCPECEHLLQCAEDDSAWTGDTLEEVRMLAFASAVFQVDNCLEENEAKFLSVFQTRMIAELEECTSDDIEWAKNALKKRRKKIKEIEREFDTELDKLPDDGDMDLLREYAESLDRYCRPLMTEEEYWSVLRRAKDRILTYEVIIKEMLRAIAERKEELDSAEGLDDFEKGRQLAYWEVMDIINTRHEIIQELLEED